MSMSDETTLTVTFTPTQLQAIDGWIARHEDPKPSREEAVAQLVSARLGADEGHQSTVIPGFVTGRDIT
jgi:hypothetical protein